MRPPRSDRPRGPRPGGKPFQKADRPPQAGGAARSGGTGERPAGRPAARAPHGSSHAGGAERKRETGADRGFERPAGKPMGKPTGKTGVRPGGKPGARPGAKPGAKPMGAKPSAQTDARPSRPSAKPAYASAAASGAPARPRGADRLPYRGPREEPARPREEAPASTKTQAHVQDRARESLTREREVTFVPRQARPVDTPRGAVWLYGIHAVHAALSNPERFLRRLVVTEEGAANLTTRLPQPWAIDPEMVERSRLDQLLGRDVVHQGVALLADLLPQITLEEALERKGPIVVLDQVTDPRNVGAILRSAAAFGVAAVILQERHAPEETGSLAKAASGALESVPLLRAVNLARTLGQLKAADCWVVGLDAEATQTLQGSSFAERRVALVLGAEGEGLRRLTRESCDELAKLPMPGEMESLNVSAASAVALYELTRKS